ncbi:MAG TPA: MBL fold metallo-hydrolase [Thermoleophilia bacterium]|nr:MBL fold metallo-hydrolase [Thermoleophilia bacterium]HZK48289.1 MBL fold metallo-hydrolase [Thermoleophilia bacterium]
MRILTVPVGPLQANCYLVADDGGIALAIDPGGEPERLISALEREGMRLTHILLTHGHFDHLAGAAGLAELTGARIACSEGTAPMLRNPDDYIPFPGFGGIPSREPDVLLADGDIISVGQLEVETVTTPGHSPGDVTFAVDGALFCGDLLFYRSVGRTDLPGGDFDMLLQSVRRLVDRFPGESRVYPGHMQPTSLRDEVRANPFLSGLSSRG